jgi:hypothetical protein
MNRTASRFGFAVWFGSIYRGTTLSFSDSDSESGPLKNGDLLIRAFCAPVDWLLCADDSGYPADFVDGKALSKISEPSISESMGSS